MDGHLLAGEARLILYHGQKTWYGSIDLPTKSHRLQAFPHFNQNISGGNNKRSKQE